MATILAPVHTFKQLRRRLVKKKSGSVTYGSGFYDRPLLVSYSRSGTNLIRYIIEYISGRPTPGQTRLVQGRDYIIDRAHCAFPIMNSYKKVILILRDYRECILRHHAIAWSENPDTLDLLTNEKLKKPASWYIENIMAFDAFQGEKLLIYYEDLLKTPDETIAKLSGFLGLDPEKTRLFIKNREAHFNEAANAYTRGGHYSETSSSKDLSFHSKNKLTLNQSDEFDQFYFTRYPVLANKYLSRYDVRNRVNPAG